MKTGWPAAILLHHWGRELARVFGTRDVYVVGSCAEGNKQHRDVDVVVLLHQKEFDKWFGEAGDSLGAPVWEAICLSFSLWGQKVTGLNIDFKVQEVEEANRRHQNKVRCCISHPGVQVKISPCSLFDDGNYNLDPPNEDFDRN